MSDPCCVPQDAELIRRQSRSLWLILYLNAAMFLVEAVGGLLAESTALLADSLDMLSDASLIALTLYALNRGDLWKRRAAVAKGAAMGLLALLVLAEAGWKIAHPVVPVAEAMGVIGVMALAVNAAAFALLYRHRADDLNLRSAWLCTRNDVTANLAVIGAAGATALARHPWPDIAVGVAIAALFLASSIKVLTEARALPVDSNPQ